VFDCLKKFRPTPSGVVAPVLLLIGFFSAFLSSQALSHDLQEPPSPSDRQKIVSQRFSASLEELESGLKATCKTGKNSTPRKDAAFVQGLAI
jgi:hypothetical protein